MAGIFATAPGKIILFGEHAVVYGYPAIAVPVSQVRAKALIMPIPENKPDEVYIEAPDIHLNSHLNQLPFKDPLRIVIEEVQNTLRLSYLPPMKIRITSTIPVAAGLGSGAAVSVALARALSNFLGHPLPDETICSIAFRAEHSYHGTPSGIDNTVITYNQPIFFQKEKPYQLLNVENPFVILIGNTGIASPTGEVVAEVKKKREQNPEKYNSVFEKISQIVYQAREFIENGNVSEMGPLLTENHRLLQEIGVSCNELDHLVETAIHNGALGAKLSGGGKGGNMIALVQPEKVPNVTQALRDAGATLVIATEIR